MQCLWSGLRTQSPCPLRRRALDDDHLGEHEPARLEALYQQVPVPICAPHAAAEREERAPWVDVLADEALDGVHERRDGLFDDGPCNRRARLIGSRGGAKRVREDDRGGCGHPQLAVRLRRGEAWRDGVGRERVVGVGAVDEICSVADIKRREKVGEEGEKGGRGGGRVAERGGRSGVVRGE